MKQEIKKFYFLSAHKDISIPFCYPVAQMHNVRSYT
ncbi:hypothetical protein ABH908_004096 [Pseudomonas frederiksbergensis]|nr:hypothetical protein F475_02464 [Pseudomonas sp. URMO17WK12:I6]CAH0288008.1 hypothetical protein SRABI130_04266 [Pseudomonas sp. Bi130]